MDIQALGLIEIKGFLGAIAAADAALKTAEVKIVNAEKIKGGLTTIQLSGDVSAVQVAVAAGSAVAQELNCLLSNHVIPRLSTDVIRMVTKEQSAQVTEDLVERQSEKQFKNKGSTEVVQEKEKPLEQPKTHKEVPTKKKATKKTDSSKKKKP